MFVEQLESRQLLAGDAGFIDALPTAEEAQFGSPVLTDQGRQACLAFKSSGLAEGELAPPPPAAPGDVDLSAVITNQPAGPLAPGAAFTSEITFENSAGSGDATATNLTVGFDAGLTGVTWQREIVRAQPAVIAATDLDGANGFRIQGDTAASFTGNRVSGVGDINNDGFDDVAVSFLGGAGSDGVFIVFGSDAGFNANLDVGSLDGTNGFELTGVDAGGFTLDVDRAGDVNGDGTDDLIVGAPGIDSSTTDPGHAFVVFGKSMFGPQVDVTAFAAGDGFSVSGLNNGDALGASVSGAGDINGDGIADIIIGASLVDQPNPSGVGTDPPIVAAGEAYVIFGKPSTSPFGTTFDLTTLDGSNGFSIKGSAEGDAFGSAVSQAGDVNGDDIDDLVVSAPQIGTSGASQLGEAFIFYGKPSTGTFDASVNSSAIDGTNGFKITGIRAGQGFGFDASGLGDINGDGFADVIVGEAPDTELDAGGAKGYVVMGHNNTAGTFDLATLNGTNGFEVSPTTTASPSHLRVSDAGDVNGDGFFDVFVGFAPNQVDTTVTPGGGFVLFGRDSNLDPYATTESLPALDGIDGFRIVGDPATELIGQAGDAIAAAGDVNGDGKGDVIMAAPFADVGATIAAGESYVVLGRGSTTTSGSGAIDETLDLGPGDKVIYRVSATIAAAASGSTVVTASATPGTGVTDTMPGNDSATAETLIQPPPEVTKIFVNDESDGTLKTRSQITSVTVEFDSILDHGPLANAFNITQIDNGTQVDTIVPTFSDATGKTVAVLSFEVTATNFASTVQRGAAGPLGDSLADGNYRLDILAANVVSGGVPMAADVMFGGQDAAVPQTDNDNFFRLYGDTNGDGLRDAVDLQVVIPTLLNQAAYRADLDSTGDGLSDAVDLQALIPTLLGPGRL